MSVRALLLPVLVALLLGDAAPAAARSIVITRFDVDVVVGPDASLVVTETIHPRFTGAWNGVYRMIPVEYRTPQGFGYHLLLDVLGVTDEAGNVLRREMSRERHYQKIKIWVPDANDASRTIVLRYRVHNGLRFFADHDELYWNVTGDEWEFPIEAASAHIVLPAGAAGVRATAFTGAYGARGQEAEVEIRDAEIEVRTRRGLGFREGLTAVVGFDKGLVREPGLVQRAILFLRANWLFLVPLGTFAIMYTLWNARGRDPRLRPVTVRYEPPEGLTPAEVGTLIDNSPDMRDLTATMVDLAVRGFLRIEEQQESTLLGLWSKNDYVFRSLRSLSDRRELKPHEQALLSALFAGAVGLGDQASVRLSDLENRFYQELPGIRDRIFEALMTRRYWAARPDRVRRVWLIVAGVVGIGSVVLGGKMLATLGVAPATYYMSSVLSALVIAGFGWLMPACTLAGARALEVARGFEEFLSRVEADRFARTVRTPEMFERFLPYAMTFGVEKNWVRAFEDIYRDPPQWYQGTSGDVFRPRAFVDRLGRMSTQAATVLASAPRGSGGSGFGGGGFSGGGFGGGGGGGF